MLAVTAAAASPPAVAGLHAVLAWIQGHKLPGVLLYILLFGVCTALLVPATFLSLAAGFLFPPVPLAAAVILLGSQLGMALAVALGRSVLRDRVQSADFARSRLFAAVQRGLDGHAFYVVCLLRVTPVMPFGMCNYGTHHHPSLAVYDPALSVVKGLGFARTLVPATLLGNAPGALLYSVLGSLATGLTDVGKGSGRLSPRARFACARTRAH